MNLKTAKVFLLSVLFCLALFGIIAISAICVATRWAVGIHTATKARERKIQKPLNHIK